MGDTKQTLIPAVPADGEALPYYQPILALDTRRVIGYESLGRRWADGVVSSLGPFFTDPRVDPSAQVRVDRLLRERAIAKLAQTEPQPMLFLNVKPSWIEQAYRSEGELPTLRMLKRHGIDPSKVAIEVMEEGYAGSMRRLRELVDIYRREGCRIAIDDVGTGFSSADRIAAIQPDILKIDLHLMKKSASHNGYLGVLRSFSALAEQIGASLLIEGIETEDDLQRAIQLGARYVQGFLFAPGEPDFCRADRFANVIDAGLAAHRRMIRASEARWRALGDTLAARSREQADAFEAGREAAASGLSPDHAELYDVLIERMLERLPDGCIRVYLCRSDGEQLSSNFRRAGGRWVREPEYRGANWSWRPYFIADLLQLSADSPANVSRSYADLDTRGWIRTISAAAFEGGILFFDFTDDELSAHAEPDPAPDRRRAAIR